MNKQPPKWSNHTRGKKAKLYRPEGLIMDGAIEPDFDALEETELDLKEQFGGGSDYNE